MREGKDKVENPLPVWSGGMDECPPSVAISIATLTVPFSPVLGAANWTPQTF